MSTQILVAILNPDQTDEADTDALAIAKKIVFSDMPAMRFLKKNNIQIHRNSFEKYRKYLCRHYPKWQVVLPHPQRRKNLIQQDYKYVSIIRSDMIYSWQDEEMKQYAIDSLISKFCGDIQLHADALSQNTPYSLVGWAFANYQLIQIAKIGTEVRLLCEMLPIFNGKCVKYFGVNQSFSGK